MTAISISSTVDLVHFKEREERYLKIAKTYSKEELETVSKILALLVLEMEKKPQDVLGEIFMRLGLGNKWTGQVFTPLSVAQTLSEMAFNPKEIEDKGFITAYDSAVGGGVTMIGLVNTMLEKGFNPQRQLLVICGDLDIKAVHMTYIQLSLLGIPAIVKNQDALTLDTKSTWYTPMYILGGWGFKRR